MLQSFHNDQSVKDKYVSRVAAHIKADALVRGTGWTGKKGCAVGCTLENYDHSRYPIELGLPEWLARLEDTLFEGMTAKKSKTWPKVFLETIPLGVNERDFIFKVKGPFIVKVLQSSLESFDHKKFPDVKLAIEGSIALWARDDLEGFSNKKRSAARSAAWSAAESAAWSAAWSAARSAAESAARSAAWSAAWSAAESAAWSAARSAAESAAWSAARSAAESAAESEKYDYFADELIKLLGDL